MRAEKKIARLLRQKGKTLAIAESCSGGLLSHRLTNIPGSSQYFLGAVVAYSNQAKIKLLKIPSRLIATYGVVSNHVACAMAQGVRKLFDSDFGVSITGIAGPSGGTKDKPVGLTCIAVSCQTSTASVKSVFTGTRLSVKSQAAAKALKLLLNALS